MKNDSIDNGWKLQYGNKMIIYICKLKHLTARSRFWLFIYETLKHGNYDETTARALAVTSITEGDGTRLSDKLLRSSYNRYANTQYRSVWLMHTDRNRLKYYGFNLFLLPMKTIFKINGINNFAIRSHQILFSLKGSIGNYFVFKGKNLDCVLSQSLCKPQSSMWGSLITQNYTHLINFAFHILFTFLLWITSPPDAPI